MGEKDKNEASMEEDLDKFFENMNQLGGNMFSITKKLLAITSDSLSEFNDKAKTKSFNWLFDVNDDVAAAAKSDDAYADDYKEFKSNIKTMLKDFHPRIEEFVNKPYEDRTTAEGCDKKRWDWHSHPLKEYWKHSFRNGQTPFGYYTYGTPSIRAYNDCVNKNGEMLYDSKGYWRCLFPNSEVPSEMLAYKKQNTPDQILTKEDFTSAKSENRSTEEGVYDLGEKGTYFKNFDLYMNWKNIMYENVRRDRQERREKIIARRKQRLEDMQAKFKPEEKVAELEPKPVAAPVKSDKPIVSMSIQSTYSSDSDKNEIVLKEKKIEYFSDGTSTTKNITKTKPYDAKDWTSVIENVDTSKVQDENLLTSELFDQESYKNGWFWNKKH